VSEQKIIDYVTGKELRSTPEEHYRQEFEHILVDDLGYPKELIAIEFPIQRGSKKQAERADIVIFKDKRHKQDNIDIIIEIKTPKGSFDNQLLTYATATTATYTGWYAGIEKNSEGPYFFYRDLKKDPTKFNTLPTLPRFGETYETIGQYKKSDLKPAKDLKILFKRIHHKLYGSGPIKREENVAQEVIKIIFCKILDELSPEEHCSFRATPSEINSKKGQKEVKKRIDDLFSELLLDPDFGELFENEHIEYSPEWVTYIVSQLQGVGLLHEETNTDALGDAYEIFLPSNLKGESGQFFTPREVVRFAIDVVAPSFEKKEIVMDPACGSGGFLTVAIEYLRKEIERVYKHRGFTKDKLYLILKDHAGKYIHGADIEPLLYKIAKSYMAVIGDGKSNIYNFDSLLPIEKYPPEFSAKIKEGGVDVITTNPPFGTKIDDVRDFVLEKFDLGHRIVDGVATNELLDGQDPDKLFLERDIKFLKNPKGNKPGGRMVIVLPRQNLSGTQQASVELRKWLLKQVKITAIVDLPREAFQPHTGTKTSLVFLEKVKNPEEDYPIFMAASEAVGHDRRGNPIYRKDDSGKFVLNNENNPIIWNDLPEIKEQWELFKSGKKPNLITPSCFVVNSKQLRNDPSCRIDAWYWDPNKNDLAKSLMDYSGNEIKEIVNLGDLVVDRGIFYPGRHKRNYVKSTDKSLPFYSGTQILQIRPFDIKHQPIDYKPARNHIVQKNWILITRSGSTGRVVIVGDELVGAMITEHVIRVIINPDLIDPYYVYAYLASENIGKVLMEKGIYASVVDHISPEFVSTIPIPRLDPKIEAKIANDVRKAEEKRTQANLSLKQSMNSIESIISSSTGISFEE
jgi:type I restriction-modification system DNA methylase subunit